MKLYNHDNRKVIQSNQDVIANQIE